MEYVLAPFGKTLGLRKIKQLTRFSEQSWMVVYYTVFWALGVVSPQSGGFPSCRGSCAC